VDAETKIEGQESSEQSKKEEAMNHRYIDISKLHRRVWIIMMTVVIIDLLAAFA
jgi:LPS O-antigen subunit length determinant protein (WzzB/FepE family)